MDRTSLSDLALKRYLFSMLQSFGVRVFINKLSVISGKSRGKIGEINIGESRMVK